MYWTQPSLGRGPSPRPPTHPFFQKDLEPAPQILLPKQQAACPVRHAACLGFLIHQYFPQDDKCPANKRRQLPTLSETRAFSWGCGHAWLVDMSPEARGGCHGWEKEGRENGIWTTALNLCIFCHESVERREETEVAQIFVQNKIYLPYLQSSYRMLNPERTIRKGTVFISI